MTLREIRQEAKVALNGNWGMAISGLVLSGLMMGAAIYFPLIVFTALIFLNQSWLSGVLLIAGMLAICLLFLMPLATGLYWMFLNFVDGKKQSMGALFDAFRNNYWKNVGTLALQSLFLALWTSLFGLIDGVFGALFGELVYFIVSVITGVILIVIVFDYVLTVDLLKDHPEWKAMEIIRESRRLMKGKKWQFFLLGLSFIGWYIPGIVLSLVGMFSLVFNVLAESDAMVLFSGGLIFLSMLYLLGIGLYVMPYLWTAYAVFYRKLKPSSDDEMISEVAGFE
ncbi:MAG: DUF975 family protein [Defluviitaleaceae bacterium]|nr:DUF975 family protein [Defluviitaleaceae bacterium]